MNFDITILCITVGFLSLQKKTKEQRLCFSGDFVYRITEWLKLRGLEVPWADLPTQGHLEPIVQEALLQDFAVPLSKPYEVPARPFLQPDRVLLFGSTTLECIGHSSRLGALRNVLCVPSAPSSKSLMKMLHRTGPSIDP